jgi:hypothetical protein
MLNRYFGKECGRHPELQGERYTANRVCPKCLMEKNKIRSRRKDLPGLIAVTRERLRLLENEQRMLEEEDHRKMDAEKAEFWTEFHSVQD